MAKSQSDVARVVLDTNFLLLPVQFHIDILGEIRFLLGRVEFLVPECVRNELRLMAGGKTEARAGANIALGLIEGKSVTAVPSYGGAVDESVLKCALENRAYVATNDRKLKQECLKQGIGVVFLRGRGKIDVAMPKATNTNCE